MPLFFIIAGFSIDLAAGRWGAYIISPIPGLYLADLLLALGSLGAAVQIRRLFAPPPLVLAIFATAGLYLAIRGFYALFWNLVPEPYLAIRDLAPFGYLALVPFIALALRGLNPVAFIWVLRVATAVHLIGFALTSLGFFTPFSSPHLGSSSVEVFDYRGDLVGVILGIGFLVWGRWPGTNAGRVIQFLCILTAFNLESRASLLSFIFCLVLALWRELSWFPPRRAVIFAVMGIVGSSLISYLAPNLTTIIYQHLESPAQTKERDTAFTLGSPALKKQLDQLGGGMNTGSARLMTWRQIILALPRDHLWLLGGGLGSDILYRICSEGDGPTDTLYAGGGSGRPKCHVDSNEAATILRDPHNWLLNLMLYHGLIGTLIFILAIAIPMVIYRHAPCSSLAIIPIGAYFVSGSFGVILSAPFGMLPVAVFLGWLLREGLAPNRPPTEQATQGPHV